MTQRHEDLFPRLTPPPGGLARLRGRLDQPRQMPIRATLAFAGGLAALVLALSWFAATPSPGDPQLDAWLGAERARHPALLQASGQLPKASVTLFDQDRGRIALQPVPVDVPGVVFYNVGGGAPTTRVPR